MEILKLITCIVQRGKSDKVVDASLKAGAGGATMFYGRGTGVRQKLGVIGKFIQAEKEIIMIVVKEAHAEEVFDTIVKAGELNKQGKGFVFIHTIEKAVGFIEPQ